MSDFHFELFGLCTRLLHTPPFNPHSCFRLSGGHQQRPQESQQQQPHQTQSRGHVSLKQTAHLRSHSEVPAFMKSTNNGPTKEQSCNASTNFIGFHQRSSSENGGNYLPYSPYATKRKEVSATRPFSPPVNPAEAEPPCLQSRPFSPWRQQQQQQQQQKAQVDQTSREYGSKRCSSNGQAYADSRSYSPYRQESSVEPSERSYSPYHAARYDDHHHHHHHHHHHRREPSGERWQNVSRSLSPFARDYSPWRRENVDPPGVVQPVLVETGRYSPFVQHRLGQLPPAPQTHPPTSQDIYGSPMISRKRFPSEPPPHGTHGSTSPQLLISRFAHQLKQDPPITSAQNSAAAGSKESAKKRFASYVRLRLGGERAPSPEPPPRMNRGESPLAVRRNMVDQASPSFPRRYVSPSPPQPPPRRLSESSSVPGSPQYVRAHLRYTPEPQRRPPPPP